MNHAKLLVYSAARALGLFALARHLTRHRVRILCFHGGSLGDEHRFNSLLFCTGEHLAQRLTWMDAHSFSWVSLSSAVDMLKGGAPRPRLPVVLTFDDGWCSTARVLGPVVARHQVPAVLYLCTSHFQRGEPVPDVSMAYLVWKAGAHIVQLEGVDPALDGSYELADPRARKDFLARSIRWIREAAAGDVGARLELLASALGISSEALDLASRRFSYLDGGELQALRAQGWAIELHGHEHLYPAGDPAALAQDLQRCQAVFASQSLPPGRHYCYPSGTHDAAAHALMTQHDVDSATTCLPGLCPEGEAHALHYLPRFLDGANVPPLVFEAEMSGFADGVRWLARLGRRSSAPPLLGGRNSVPIKLKDSHASHQ